MEAYGEALVLQVADLDVRYGRHRQVHALRGVDLRIAAGEIVALVGESGSGKTTLALAVQGLLPSESHARVTGSIRIDGREVVDASPDTLRDIRQHSLGAIFQDPLTSLNPSMRVRAQLAEAAPTGTFDMSELLSQVGIRHPDAVLRAYPHELSGGQRQRVMITMALASHPRLIIADEPTTALDVTVQARILELIRSLREQTQAGLLFVTHDLGVAAAVSDRVVVLYAGRVVEEGRTSDILRDPAHPYTAALLAARFGLDVDRAQPLPMLGGEPPSPTAEHYGCPFAPRCPLVIDKCHDAVPRLLPVARHAGSAACIRTEDSSGTMWRPRTESRSAVDEPADSRDNTLVEAKGLVKRFGGRRRLPWQSRTGGVAALDGVDIRIEQGASLAVVGESGSGKSTLLRVLAGLVEPDKGEVRIAAEDRPQMIYQDATLSLTPWLTVSELVSERLRSTVGDRHERREAAAQALTRVGLSPSVLDHAPAQLSGGQRQRVAIARAIVMPPTLLLCDEPTSALDVSLAAAILNLLRDLQHELGMTMAFVTHDLAAARYIADEVVVMRSGVVVERGRAEEVSHAPRHEYTRDLIAAMPKAAA